MPGHKVPLSDGFVRTLKKPGKYTDGPTGFGLYLRARLSSDGKRLLKRHYQKRNIGDRPVDLYIGPYPEISLTDARKIAFANAQLIENGGDPREEKKKKQAVPTLAAAAESHLEVRGVEKSKRYMEKKRILLRNHAKPLLDRKVDTITREDVRQVLDVIWRSEHATANSLRMLLSMIFKWANGKGHRGKNPDNPADDVVIQLLPDIQYDVQNHPSLPFQEINSFITDIGQATHVSLSSRLALKFKILTATRSGETVGGRWDEIDLDRTIFIPQDESLPSLIWPCWVIPPERYKTRTELVVPLSIRAIQVLVEATKLSHLHPHLIFPAPQGNMLTALSLGELQHRFTETVPHGLRNSFKDWTQTYRVNQDVPETALGHSLSTHGGAYGRAILAGIRIYLMHDWAEYNCGTLPPGYRWAERFFPEEPDTYPDEGVYLIREDIDALRDHLESDIAGDYFRGIQAAFQSIRTAENLFLPHKLLALFAALTGAGTSHVITAKVGDIDVDRKTWTIAAEHNTRRSGEDIHIPLSDPALAIYTRALNEISRGDSGLLFPSKHDRQLSATTIHSVFVALKLNITPTLLRSAFREWALDKGFTGHLIEKSLGLSQSKPLFVGSNSTPAAERDWRTRVRMMKQWADFLHGK